MANRNFKRDMGSLDSAVVKLYGSVTFGSSGAVSSQDCRGFSVAIVDSEAGRYKITLEDKYNKLLGASAALVVADDTALTIADGNHAVFRDDEVDAGTLLLQLVRLDTGADADPTSGTVLHLELTLKNSSVTY